ncbi:MAG: tetratricopeptide repeat protein [Gemmatimonadaceae bacterium]|nr:tetratricopeptide repeat protein [Gemmatimonadaceae bacterium]
MLLRDKTSSAAAQAASIFAAALAARWIYVHQSGGHPLRDVPLGPGIPHVERASGEAAGFASLYDALLAGAGVDLELARAAQVVLGALNCVLLWSLARAALPPGAALAAGLALAFYGPAIYFSGEILPPVLATSLVLLALIALARAFDSSHARGFWLPGVLLGLAVLAESWVCLFALALPLWLVRSNRGAALPLAVGTAAVLLPAFLWSAWTPETAPGLAEGVRRTHALWQGGEFLAELDPYYGGHQSSLLSVLLWDNGLAFPFGLVGPLALAGIVSRLRGGRPLETALLIFAACFTAQALLFPSADSAVRAAAVPVLLIFAAAGVTAIARLPRGPALAAGAACLLLAAGLNAGDAGADGRARQHYWLGHGFAQLGLRANAVREYETALALDPESLETYNALAGHYLASEDAIRAAGLYERLLQRWPGEHEARGALAEVYITSGRAAEAARSYRELIEARAGPVDSLLTLLGDALVRSGDVEGGIDAYEQALEAQPGNAGARGMLALLYSTADRLPEAEEASRRLFEEGRVAEYGPVLAQLLIRTGRDAEAAEVLEQVLETAPDSGAALGLRGRQLHDQGRHREAAAHFERLRELWPEDHRAHYYLALIYERLGEEILAEEARSSYVRYQRDREREDLQGHMKLVTSLMTDQLQSRVGMRQ